MSFFNFPKKWWLFRHKFYLRACTSFRSVVTQIDHAQETFQKQCKMASKSLNEEIECIQLYRRRPFWLHYYLAPFLPLYLIWLYTWVTVFGVSEYFEAGMIILAGIGIVQILSGLFCHWSVHVLAFFTCSSVSSFVNS